MLVTLHRPALVDGPVIDEVMRGLVPLLASLPTVFPVHPRTRRGVPCFRLRDTTERPITVSTSTNTLLGMRPEGIAEIPQRLAATNGRPHRVPDGWDGAAATRIAEVLARQFDATSD